MNKTRLDVIADMVDGLTDDQRDDLQWALFGALINVVSDEQFRQAVESTWLATIRMAEANRSSQTLGRTS